MKMSHVFLVLGFVLILTLYSDAQPLTMETFSHPEPCCFNFFTEKINHKNILNVKMTGSHCPQQGYIIATPKHSSLCVREITVNGQD
ncbi:C-C motif chemokine 13-like [Hemibagrus wyckioides]|uniref:C-C motif chemokine 13-like n=1 Tax=Hemibagrus wyckioides TaxID=337641 RepID=UPI00266C51E5|nr:C-C motif chemokine 13-like [Hemibagrus wyckioides]